MSGNNLVYQRDINSRGEPMAQRSQNGAAFVSVVDPITGMPSIGATTTSAGVDRSVTTSTTSSQLMAANTARRGLFIANDTAIDVWINFGATAVATAGGGNIKIGANGGRYESGAFTPSTAINIIATSGTPAITAREFIAVSVAVADAPVIGTATAGRESASLTFTPGASNGGYTVQDYLVSAYDSLTNVRFNTFTATASPVTMAPIPAGISAYFKVQARTANGFSTQSGASNAVNILAPFAVPGAPQNVVATLNGTTVTSTYTAPAINGGSAIDVYRSTLYRASDNVQIDSVTGTGPLAHLNVPANTALYTKVDAHNVPAGYGFASPSNIVIAGAEVPPPTTIGPYTLGDDVINSGRTYKATTGDDFTSGVSFITPGAPSGKYSTTRTYQNLSLGNGPRGNSAGSLALKGYDADAGHTGHNDGNRGAAMTSFADLITNTGGRLVLKSRTATAPEKANFVNTSAPNASAMISTAPAMVVSAPFFAETKMKLTKAQANMRGWHPTFWMMQMKSVSSYTATELDWEANSLQIAPNKYTWTNGSSSNAVLGTPITYNSAQEYVFRIEVLADGSVNFYKDGAFIKTLAAGTVADTTRPYYVMLTNHVADFPEDPYNDADWVAGGTAGCVMDADYIFLATSVGTLYSPLIADQTYNYDYGAALNVTLPSATAVWGSEVTEDIESWAQESNEPGGDYQGGYLNKPPGLTYDLGTLSITGTPILNATKIAPKNNSGRIMVCRYTRVAGTACVPHRTIINIGPHLAVTNLPNATVGSAYSYDLYSAADCGVLVCDASGNRTKTVSISGLPSGLSYNDTTGLITGTPLAEFDNTVTVTITNSQGQVGVGTATFIGIVANAGTVAPTITGAPTVRSSWDFDKLSSLTLAGSVINAVAGTDSTAQALANASGTTAPTRVLRTSNQRYAAQFSLSSAQFLQATGLTLTTGGTVVCIFELNTVATSQIIFERAQAASATTVNREELIGLIAGTSLAARRANATASGDTAYDTTSYQPGLHLMIATFSPSGGTIQMYLDGKGTPQTGTASGGQPVGMDTITMGIRQAAGAQTLPFDGYIHRVIEYPTVLTAQQVEEIAAWANKNYGTGNLA